jgi:excisionase family DNA binding protein
MDTFRLRRWEHEKTMQKGSSEISVVAQTLWTIHEAASFLRISTGTLYHWVSEGKIPCLHFGARCLRFDPHQIKKWAEDFSSESATYNRTPQHQ